MGDRMDEAQGRVKQGVGTLTGDEEQAREGEAQAERAKLKRAAEGAVDEGTGKVQEQVGAVTDDTETELKGKARQVEGRVERTG